jgi:hypothetical protein
MDQLFKTWPDAENSISSFGDSSPTYYHGQQMGDQFGSM